MITEQMQLLEFLDELRRGKIYYRLGQHRDDAIMVEITVPGERWEIEFLEDGTIEAEVFRSNGNIEGANAVMKLLADHSDVTAAPGEAHEPRSLALDALSPFEDDAGTMQFDDSCLSVVSRAVGEQLVRMPGRATTLFESIDRRVRILGRMSVPHGASDRPIFWFNYEDRREAWLLEIERGFLAFACGSADQILLIPAADFKSWTQHLSVTPRRGFRQWNVRVVRENHSYSLVGRSGWRTALDSYLIK